MSVNIDIHRNQGDLLREYIDVTVIGGGQPGLAAAHTLLCRGLRPVALEASDRTAGSWPRYYDSLTLFSPARYSSLPGLPFPGVDRDRYPHRDEAVASLTAHADRLNAEVRTGCRVSAVRRDDGAFAVEPGEGGRLSARAVVAASGAFGRPHRPALPGLEEFTGQLLHAVDYRSPAPLTGRRAVVIGAGNSAVRFAAELAQTTRVTLATRGPLKFTAQRILSRDSHFWLTRTGLDTAPLDRLLPRPSAQPVIDDSRYRAALAAGQPDRRPLFTGADGARLVLGRTGLNFAPDPTGARLLQSTWTPTQRCCSELPDSALACFSPVRPEPHPRLVGPSPSSRSLPPVVSRRAGSTIAATGCSSPGA